MGCAYWSKKLASTTVASAVLLTSTWCLASLPDDARSLLNRLPGKAVSLDVVLARAIQSSDSYQQAVSQFPLTELPRLQAHVLLEPQAYAKYSWLRDDLEPTYSFMPSAVRNHYYTLGVSKNFSTGTTLGAEILQGRSHLNVANSAVNYYESKARLTLSQSLWRNFFGQGARASLRAGDYGQQARVLEFRDGLENWSLQIMNLFYDSWWAQARVNAALAHVQRRERLERTMMIKGRRGTAEEPELLQVRSVLIAARTQLAEAEQLLRERWQGLVLILKLPSHWLELDPKEIPIVLDNPTAEAQKLCTASMDQIKQQKFSQQVEQKRLDAKASEAKLAAAKSFARPDLALTAQYAANGIDSDSRVDSWSETQSYTHPSLTIGVSLTVPLMGYQEEANYRTAAAEHARADAAAREAEDKWQLEWLTLCHNLQRLQKDVSELNTALEYQLKRAKLDDQRFAIGRTNILTVIQSGDDATQADVNLNGAQVGLRQTAWKIIKLGGRLEDHMRSLEKMEALKL